jgi:translocator protein
MAALFVATMGGTMTDLGPWYQSLRMPAWKPPDWLFGPAWTLIFALAALAGLKAWQSAGDRASREWVIGLFALNGFLNIMWSVFFFRFKRPDWALLEVLLLWLSILLLIVFFLEAGPPGKLAFDALSRLGVVRRDDQSGRRSAQRLGPLA